MTLKQPKRQNVRNMPAALRPRLTSVLVVAAIAILGIDSVAAATVGPRGPARPRVSVSQQMESFDGALDPTSTTTVPTTSTTSTTLAATTGSAPAEHAAVEVTAPLTGTAPTRAAAPSRSSSPTTARPTPTTVPRAASGPPPLVIGTTTSNVNWVQVTVHLTYGGLVRDYLMIRPSSVSSQPVPVLLALEGSAVNPTYEATRMAFTQVASPAIIVFPDPYQGYWDAGACCGQSAADHVDDVGFIAAVIADVQATQPDARPGPVYMAGYSNGGKMAMMFTCQRPTLVQAVSVYGATRTSDCGGPPPASVLEVVGTADGETAIGPGHPVTQNGYTEPTVSQIVSSYMVADGCSQDHRAGMAGSVGETLWDQCAAGRQVGVAIYNGYNHGWPETSGATPSAQQVMWDYFVGLGA